MKVHTLIDFTYKLTRKKIFALQNVTNRRHLPQKLIFVIIAYLVLKQMKYFKKL